MTVWTFIPLSMGVWSMVLGDARVDFEELIGADA